jgi:trypsin
VACGLFAALGCDIDRVTVCAAGSSVAVGTRGAALLNGSEQGDFAALGPEEEAAVVHLEAHDIAGQQLGSCTGIAVGARAVLSAGHCVPEAVTARVVVSIGASADAADRRVEAVLAGRHPELDLSVLELSSDAPALAPFPLASRLPEPGSVVQLAGFGEDELGQLGHRRFVAEEVTRVDPDSIVVDGHGRSGACRGDSGGPLIVRDWDGGAAVAGILSGGNVGCTGVDRYTRVDLARAWISSVAALEPNQPVCGRLDSVGRCFGGLATWCEGHALRARRCSDGTACGWDVAAAGFRCVAPAVDPCAGIDDHGRCDGAVLVRCSSGVLEESDCQLCEARCERDPKTGTAACESDRSGWPGTASQVE